MTLLEEFDKARAIVTIIRSDRALPAHGLALWSILAEWLELEQIVLACYPTPPDYTSELPSVKLVRLLNQTGEEAGR